MLRTDWDYTCLSEHYDKRAPYSGAAIDRLVSEIDIELPASVADIGAGTGKLSVPLIERGLIVTAVEPNDAMRRVGERNTRGLPVAWREGVGERTGLESDTYQLVTFGSSFNVVNQAKALREAHRILVPKGWFACMWNHRALSDDLQSRIESTIKKFVSDYSYGSRREDQTVALEESCLFGPVRKIEGHFVSEMNSAQYLEAWHSHATLERQAGDKFDTVLAAITEQVGEAKTIAVPYTTRIWFAQLTE